MTCTRTTPYSFRRNWFGVMVMMLLLRVSFVISWRNRQEYTGRTNDQQDNVHQGGKLMNIDFQVKCLLHPSRWASQGSAEVTCAVPGVPAVSAWPWRGAALAKSAEGVRSPPHAEDSWACEQVDLVWSRSAG